MTTFNPELAVSTCYSTEAEHNTAYSMNGTILIPYEPLSAIELAECIAVKSGPCDMVSAEYVPNPFEEQNHDCQNSPNPVALAGNDIDHPTLGDKPASNPSHKIGGFSDLSSGAGAGGGGVTGRDAPTVTGTPGGLGPAGPGVIIVDPIKPVNPPPVIPIPITDPIVFALTGVLALKALYLWR